jgi:hypothetical protein
MLAIAKCIRMRQVQKAARYESHKRGLNTKIHLAVDGMPLRIIITEDTSKLRAS